MDGHLTSDSDPTMAASKTFDRILYIIQQSNLNFALQVSPFSANISLKKSLVRDKAGSFRFPPEPLNDIENKNSKDIITALVAENNKLENVVTSLKQELGADSDEREVAYGRIKYLEDKLDVRKS